MVADDTLTDAQIAQRLHMTKRGLEKWKLLPAFQAAVAAEVQKQAEAIRAEGIANRQNRIDAANERWRLMKQVIAERAEADEMQNVPGGKTGLLVRQVKSIGFGDQNQIVEEFALDTGLLSQMLAHEKQSAQDLGQWQDKPERPDLPAGASMREVTIREVIVERPAPLPQLPDITVDRD